MSWQAMGAVQMCSQYAVDDVANFVPFKILLALAWHADSNGVIGVAGNPFKCPGQRAIAARARMSKTTVNDWLPRLVDSGELAVVDRGGAGRGSWTVWRICLPMDEAGSDTFNARTSQLSEREADINTGTLLQEMYQLMREMYQRMYQQTPEMYQQNVPNVPEPPEVARPDPYNPGDPEGDPGEGGPPPPTAAPPAAGTEPDQDAYADEMWQLAQDVVGDWLRLVGHYRKLSPQNAAHSADYYAPAVRLVHEFGGNRAAAWTALETAYHGMLHAGMTPRRLAPVVEQVIGNLNRQRSPVPAAAARPQPSANGSGGQQPRAVAALEEFKRRLAQQESDA